jgi:hypothetical protein
MKIRELMAIELERLYVLRNQLIQNGAKWNTKTNPSQVDDGVYVIRSVVLIMINVMTGHSNRHLGDSCYPVIESVDSARYVRQCLGDRAIKPAKRLGPPLLTGAVEGLETVDVGRKNAC